MKKKIKYINLLKKQMKIRITIKLYVFDITTHCDYRSKQNLCKNRTTRNLFRIFFLFQMENKFMSIEHGEMNEIKKN